MRKSGDFSVDPSHDDQIRRASVLAPKAPFVRSPYNYDTNAASDESGLRCEDPSLASQSYKEECDINFIIDRFTRTGQLPNVGQPLFADYSDIPSDFHSALNTVKAGDAAFMTLPAAVRSRFDNDPGSFLEFVANRDNYDEAVSLGLIPAKEPELPPAPPQGRGGKKAPGKAPVEPQGGEGDD